MLSTVQDKLIKDLIYKFVGDLKHTSWLGTTLSQFPLSSCNYKPQTSHILKQVEAIINDHDLLICILIILLGERKGDKIKI